MSYVSAAMCLLDFKRAVEPIVDFELTGHSAK